MISQNQDGFTIIEVILFLALSGAFLMIAFTGIRGSTEKIQFTDSMRSLHSFLISEQNKVANGVNSSSALPTDCNPTADPLLTTGGSNNCVLIGRIVSFNDASSTVGVDVMFGDKVSTSYNIGTSDLIKISGAKPRADDTSSNYEIEWASLFNLSESENHNSTKNISNISMIGWLRSPDSSNIIPIIFTDGESVNSTGTYNPYSTSFVGTAIEGEVNTRLCFTGANGQVASMNFGSGAHLSLVFDDTECL